jgi:hypothetical protein
VTDIVERRAMHDIIDELRAAEAAAFKGESNIAAMSSLITKAADAIERLRTALISVQRKAFDHRPSRARETLQTIEAIVQSALEGK